MQTNSTDQERTRVAQAARRATVARTEASSGAAMQAAMEAAKEAAARTEAAAEAEADARLLAQAAEAIEAWQAALARRRTAAAND